VVFTVPALLIYVMEHVDMAGSQLEQLMALSPGSTDAHHIASASDLVGWQAIPEAKPAMFVNDRRTCGRL
jgi:hypothetical protein